jgi:hypothetical protein
MPWVRFDDQFTIHRKIGSLTDAEYRLHTEAIFWCARNLTDGAIEPSELRLVSRARGLKRLVGRLVERGLWHEPGQGCGTEDCPGPVDNAFTLHDYLAFQPSKRRVAAARQSNAERQQKWRDQRNHGSSNGTRNGVTNAPRNSAPSRPDPKGRDGGSVGDKSSLRIAGADDDPNIKIDTRIVELLRETADVVVSLDWAAKVRHQILDGREVKNPSAYVAKAIREAPGNYVPAAGRDPSSRSVDEAIRAARGDS